MRKGNLTSSTMAKLKGVSLIETTSYDMKIKKGDNVKIISGNDKGKQGNVLAVFPKENRIVVEGMNMKKKHVGARRQDKKGEMIRIPAAFAVSRAMLICPACSQASRITYTFHDGHKKVRICNTCRGEL